MTATPRLALCAGSFDPPTNGHLDIIERAAALFDHVVVAVLVNAGKQPLFDVEERLAMLRESAAGLGNVEVDAFSGLLADYARARGARIVVRGLRTAAEFAEEAPTAMMNRHLNADLDTVFLVPSPRVAYISSRLVKEIAALGGSLAGLVPPAVATRLAARAAARRR
jgi:pantetheine-phosphate adenylyltransferase